MSGYEYPLKKQPRKPIAMASVADSPCSLVIDETPISIGNWRTDYECGSCGARAHQYGPFVLKMTCASCGIAIKAQRYRVKDGDNG